MQPTNAFSILLATLLLALAQVEAVPVKQPHRMVTMPLKRIPQSSDVHPAVRLQQHVNHGHRRHARMSGLQGPSEAELAKRLYRAHHSKRFNRGDAFSPPSDGGVSIEGVHTLASNDTVPDGNSTTPSEGFPQAGLDHLLNDSVTKAGTPTAPNSIGLDIEGRDIGYLATIEVGTPPRKFSLIMDSGSADFWIGGEGCKTINSTEDCGNHVFLGPSNSSSFEDTGTPFNVTYGSGAVTGNIISDNINIAGLALDGHKFGVALEESDNFTNGTFADGLMGLAKSSLSQQRVPTPVEALAEKNLIKEAITSYKISRVTDGVNDGEITFGGLDESKFDPKTLVTVKNVNKLGFWEAPFTASVDGTDLGLGARTAILDTGTTLVLVPESDAATLHGQIPGSIDNGDGYFTIPCKNQAVVSLTFGGQAFDINPSDLLFQPLDGKNLTGDCVSGITSTDLRLGNGVKQPWLVGDVFLKNAYFSTNVNNNSISLAKLV